MAGEEPLACKASTPLVSRGGEACFMCRTFARGPGKKRKRERKREEWFRKAVLRHSARENKKREKERKRGEEGEKEMLEEERNELPEFFQGLKISRNKGSTE